MRVPTEEEPPSALHLEATSDAGVEAADLFGDSEEFDDGTSGLAESLSGWVILLLLSKLPSACGRLLTLPCSCAPAEASTAPLFAFCSNTYLGSC